MGVFYETTAHIGAGEAGLCCQCRPAGVLTLIQEAAAEAACAFHASGPEMLEKYNALWMVTRMWYRLERPLLWDERVTIRTWHRADRGAALYRDFDLLVDGAPVGEAVSLWVLVDADSRRLLRLSTVAEIAATGGEELCKTRKLTRVRMPAAMALKEVRRFHYSDIDCNGHVNNVRYADLLADGAGLEQYMDHSFVSSLQIGYLKECRAGETIQIHTAVEGSEHFVHGVDEAGESRFDGVLTLSPLNE